MAGANKNAATEDDIGKTHRLISKLTNRQLELMDEKSEGVEDPLELSLIIDPKTMAAAARWVEYNKVSCNIPTAEGESEMSKRLKRLKEKQSGKVVSMFDEEEVKHG